MFEQVIYNWFGPYSKLMQYWSCFNESYAIYMKNLAFSILNYQNICLASHIQQTFCYMKHEIKYIQHQTFIQIKSLFYLVQNVPLWSFPIFHKRWCSKCNSFKKKGAKKGGKKKGEGNQSKNKTIYSSKLKPGWYSYAGWECFGLICVSVYI